jgi:hypothetical protein
VNADEHGPFARKTLWIGPINERRDALPVEAFHFDQRWLDELLRIKAAGFAFRPALDLPGFRVERIDVEGRSGRVQIERKVAAVRVPLQIGRNALREFGGW